MILNEKPTGIIIKGENQRNTDILCQQKFSKTGKVLAAPLLNSSSCKYAIFEHKYCNIRAQENKLRKQSQFAAGEKFPKYKKLLKYKFLTPLKRPFQDF